MYFLRKILSYFAKPNFIIYDEWFDDNLEKAGLNLISKKIIYSLSIFGFVFILGFLLFFISQSKKNESNLTNKSILLEKRF